MPPHSREAWIEFPASFRDQILPLIPSTTHLTLLRSTWCDRKGEFFWKYHIKIWWEHPANNNTLYKFLFLLQALQVKPYNWVLELAIFQPWMEKHTDMKVHFKRHQRGDLQIRPHWIFLTFCVTLQEICCGIPQLSRQKSKTYCIELADARAEHFF